MTEGESFETWVQKFEKEWREYHERLAWLPDIFSQKQQHMTPISIKDPKLIERFTQVVREADSAFRNNGGGTRNWVQDLVLPMLEAKGICFCLTSINDGPTISAGLNLKDYPKTPAEALSESGRQDTSGYGHTKYTDHGIQNLQSKATGEVAGKMKDFIQQEFGTMVKPPVTVFGIGTAVEAAELHRKKVARRGWNGKDMYVYYVPAGNWPAVTDIAKQNFGETVPYNHYLAIKNVDGTVSPWAPSVSDALAKDWYVVD